MNRRQKADIEHTIRLTHSIHGRGEVIAIVWGIHYAGFDHTRQGIAVHQMQYGMGALHFSVTEDLKCIRYLHRDRLVLHIPRSRKTA